LQADSEADRSSPPHTDARGKLVTEENVRRLKMISVLMDHAEECPKCGPFLNGPLDNDDSPCNFGRMIFKIGRFAFSYTDDIPPALPGLYQPSPTPALPHNFVPPLLETEDDLEQARR
jgi:hypothetical protein